MLRRLFVVLLTSTVVLVGIPAAANAGTETVAVTAEPDPVILVAGLTGLASAYEPLADRLHWDGYRVFIYQLPELGVGDIAASATAFGGFVDEVRSATGAARVDVVGHSEGGLVSRYYIKYLGGANKVDSYVSLGTPQYGTYVANIVSFYSFGTCVGVTACEQMTIGSSFLSTLNAGDDTPDAVRWTAVFTLQDELVQPVWNASLQDGATNVLVQSPCPLRVVGHLGLILDGTVYTIVRSALRGGTITANCFAI